MCLIAFALDPDSELRLVLAANRDEFHARPSAAAAWWPDAPGVLGGRDLSAGGGWLGVTRDGRWAAVTNFRDPGLAQDPLAPSRGELVADYLRGSAGAADFVRGIAPRADRWNGFNLLCGDLAGAWWLSNRGPGGVEILPGVHGLSNALLDTPWPKVQRARADLSAALAGPRAALEERLFESLARRETAAADELPDTGIGRDRERALSSIFIEAPGYGTRASAVLRIERSGRVRFAERTWRPGEASPHEVRYDFRM